MKPLFRKYPLMGLFLCLYSGLAFSQTYYFTTYEQNTSIRLYSGCETKLCDRYSMVSWDSYYRQFAGWTGTPDASTVNSFLNFRVMFPPGYDINDSTKKYPVIVMLHGAGESGRIWTNNYNYDISDPRYDNNSHNLLHGGNEHRQAVQRPANDPRAFPGIVVFPQAPYNGAHSDITQQNTLSQNEEFIVRFLQEQIVGVYHGDINRIYMHGLSNGARCTWALAIKRPDLFAAIHPMSGTPYNTSWAADKLVTIPIRLSQGGTDTNPNPVAGQLAVDAMNNAGGSAEMILFPNLGHGVWVDTYNRPDFFSWLLSKNKLDIHVFGGDPSICEGNNVRLGFSKGMTAYQWRRNGVDILGATNWDYSTNIPGVYTVAFTRPNGTTDVSNPVEVTEKEDSSLKPTLTYNSTTASPYLPITGIASPINIVTLTAEPGFSQYRWYKNDGILQTNTSNTLSINTGSGSSGNAGNYTVQGITASGCDSQLSDPVTLYYFNPNNPPGTPTGVTAQGIAPTETRVNWTDVTGEVKYEIWRYRFNTSGANGYNSINWRFVGSVPANTTTFVDKGLNPGATYRYKVRAIGLQGTAANTQEIIRSPTPDNIPPTAPSNLTATNITDTQVTLTWDAATDNDRVYKYQIFNGSTLIATVSGSYSYAGGADVFTDPPTTYTVTDLAPGTTYFFSVRALDFITPLTSDDNLRNYSPLSEVAEVTTQSSVNGLQFKYYTHSGLSGNNDSGASQLAEPYTTTNGPNFNFENPSASANGQLVEEGVVSNFDISGAFTYQNTSDPNNFVYAFDGYLQVNQTGRYRFFTRSDDGSRLYIDANNDGDFDSNEILNNDGAQAETTVWLPNSPTSYFTLNAGVRYKIRVTYFENTGGNVLYVRYTRSTSGSPSTAFPDAGDIPNSWLYQTGTIVSTYYLKSNADGENPTINTAWTTNPSGSGGTTAPANVFANPNTVFVLANRQTVTINDEWTISGSGSKVVVGNGTDITLNLNAAVNATMEASANATINVNHATVPQFTLMDATSTVNFTVLPTGGNIPIASYGNVTLTASGQYNFPMSTTTIKGNLNIANGVTTTGVAKNLTTLRIGGDLTINNTSGNPFPATGDQQYALVFTGGKTHTVNFTTPVDPTLFSIQTDFGDVVNFNGLSGRTFTVGSSQGGGLSLKGSSRLNLGNNNLVVTERGTINANSETGTLSMAGGNFNFMSTAAQNSTVYFADNSEVNNFTSSTPANNRLSINGRVTVNNLVNVLLGELYCGSGYLALKSTSDSGGGTARIGSLLNGAKVTGEINFQRYMSGEGRIYRYISSPVKGFTAQQLQQFFPITGKFSGANTDAGLTSANTSMYEYNEPEYVQFPAVDGTNQQAMEVGKGYSAFIRKASEATVIEYVGEANQGTVTFNLTGGTGSPDDGWNLLGNPYPAPIQWTGNPNGGAWISSGGVSNIIYVRENWYEDGQAYTAVRTYDAGWDGKVAPGQAFWVRTTTSNPTLSITENAKATTDAAFYRDGSPANELKITMRSEKLQDVAVIRFLPEATPEFDTEIDGVKLDNSFFNLSTLTTDGEPLVINNTTADYCSQEVPLRITNAADGTYQLEIEGVESILTGDKVTLVDNFTGTETAINDAHSLSFSITSDPASKADGRFVLRFEKPEVWLVAEGDNLVASIENAHYVWYRNGEELIGQNGRTLEHPENGTYQVEATQGSCTKISEPIVFVVTAAETSREEQNNQQSPYPNPTRNKVTVTLSQPILLNTIRTVSVVGQIVEAPVQPLTENSVEVDFSELPSGLYLLYVNEKRYRVIRE